MTPEERAEKAESELGELKKAVREQAGWYDQYRGVDFDGGDVAKSFLGLLEPEPCGTHLCGGEDMTPDKAAKISYDLSKIVHDKCRDVPHDMGLTLWPVVEAAIREAVAELAEQTLPRFLELRLYREEREGKAFTKDFYDVEKMFRDAIRARRERPCGTASPTS